MKASARTARFLAIGWIGFAVQTVVLAGLIVVASWPWLPATCLAVEASIVHNFFWHERWTWSDRAPAPTIASRVLRFAKYNLATGVVSIGGNVALTALYLQLPHMSTILANALAVATLTIVNFLVADRWIWATAVLCLWTTSAHAQPAADTIHAWDRYVAGAEARIERERLAGAPSPTDVSGDTVDVPSGAIHDWRGVVFVPGITLDRLLNDLMDPRIGTPRQEDVAESRTIARTDDSIRTYLRLVRRAIVTVTYDTEHEMTFRRWSPTLASARSVETSIREVGGSDHGFLWRLNSYWRYRQTAGGVVVDLESITLSRSIPAVVRPFAMPIVNHIARESMARTLDTFRARFATLSACACSTGPPSRSPAPTRTSRGLAKPTAIRRRAC